MKYSFAIFSALFLLSCSKVQTLNMNDHNFNKEPRKIIWLQIAGFDYKQLPMIRYTRSQSVAPSSLEMFDCLGALWSYNLYKLRPNAEDSFLAQMTGKTNIHRSCHDAALDPFWKYLPANINVGIFETEGGERQSLSSLLSCKKKSSFYDQVWLWKMEPSKEKLKSSRYFHYLDRGELKLPGVYYDRSCKKMGCYSSFYSNILSLFERFSKDKERFVFVVRDFSYAKALASKNIPLSREILSDLEKVVDYFFDSLNYKQDSLLLVTSAATKRIDLPPSGMKWKDFIRKGKGVLFHQNGLSSVALAKGARSENFCGIYEESDILRRLLFTPKEPQGLEALFKQ